MANVTVIKFDIASTYDPGSGTHYWNGTLATPANTRQSVVVATDNWNVSAVVVIRQDGVAPGESFASDGRYNVTFRAVDLVGYTANCTSEVSTFTARKAWAPEELDMDAAYLDTSNKGMCDLGVAVPTHSVHVLKVLT